MIRVSIRLGYSLRFSIAASKNGDNLLQTILDIIYPVRCPVCGEIVLPREDMICLACKDKLKFIIEPRCKKCSKPLEIEEKEYCNDCEHKNYQYIYGFSVWVYDKIMKKSISDYKYNGKKEYARYYASETVRIYGERIKRIAPDLLIPVPIHKSKYRERGYNQTDILARLIGKDLDIPVASSYIIRTRKTMPQKQLSDKERLKNLQEAFAINPNVYTVGSNITRVMLVDDIYTTGSTIEACTNVLIKSGIKDVYFLTLCIGKGY